MNDLRDEILRKPDTLDLGVYMEIAEDEAAKEYQDYKEAQRAKIKAMREQEEKNRQFLADAMKVTSDRLAQEEANREHDRRVLAQRKAFKEAGLVYNEKTTEEQAMHDAYANLAESLINSEK
ncbi:MULTISPECIES: hypothetical protein [Aerococcus]|uniref:hypothetical protein n=1 Tax=Aerococcus TaxID=1375 RepID=UPI000DCC9A53|nr:MULTISPECIES: hypothetical protein [Aerococcus]KAA9299812.1 hypothetical protein F6I08_00120 [Aerococcus tenax]MDK8133224.1 hypothetical protein [Aerococcus urinae]MDK8485367.1 hypothetical protein [Aerococcus urinae]MDL5178304.1 hypothetical protein [Aerococcus tenax]MDL5207319.1 hypothetical protein [Aerococcus tenax]